MTVRAAAVGLAVALIACGGGGDDTGTEVDGAAVGDGASGDATVVDAPPADGPAVDARVDASIDARPVDAGPDAPPGLRVFVTSLRYPADLRTAGGGADGLDGGDRICQTHADAIGLGGTFRAWLSTTSVDAIDHIEGNGPWYRMDGALAFPNRARLATTPLVAITLDEQLGTPSTFYEVWTGTALGGRRAPLGSRVTVTCYDWTSTIDSASVGGVLGTHGPIESLPGNGPEWTQFATGYCSPFSRHLYCFEQ